MFKTLFIKTLEKTSTANQFLFFFTRVSSKNFRPFQKNKPGKLTGGKKKKIRQLGLGVDGRWKEWKQLNASYFLRKTKDFGETEKSVGKSRQQSKK